MFCLCTSRVICLCASRVRRTHSYIQKDGRTDRQTDGQTDRQAGRQKVRWTGRHADKQYSRVKSVNVIFIRVCKGVKRLAVGCNTHRRHHCHHTVMVRTQFTLTENNYSITVAVVRLLDKEKKKKTANKLAINTEYSLPSPEHHHYSLW